MTDYGMAAEYVGVVSGSNRDNLSAFAQVEVVPAGVAHAFDPGAGRTLCGAPIEPLVLFVDSWHADLWTIHCPLCGLLDDGGSAIGP